MADIYVLDNFVFYKTYSAYYRLMIENHSQKNRLLIISKRLFYQNILLITLVGFILTLTHYLEHQLVLAAGFVRMLDQNSQVLVAIAGSYHASRYH